MRAHAPQKKWCGTNVFGAIGGCYPDCHTTFDNYMNYQYHAMGGVYCQGLPRDPADSQFAVPVWLPYYDQLYGTESHVIMSELVCEYDNGAIERSVTSIPVPVLMPTWKELPAIFDQEQIGW